MQYAVAYLASLAATGALALPHSTRQTLDQSVIVTLSSIAEDIAITQTFEQVQFGEAEAQAVTQSSVVFDTVSLSVGRDVPNQALRCQITDDQGRPITIQRGAATDVTFADGGLGDWSFLVPSTVSEIVCDPVFVAGPPSVVVTLSNLAEELATQTTFVEGGVVREELPPNASSGPFTTFLLTVDAEVKGLRCQLLDANAQPITGQRNGNIDTTFAGGAAGAWTLLDANLAPASFLVETIVCDPAFVADPLDV